jgi:hypothetical protein
MIKGTNAKEEDDDQQNGYGSTAVEQYTSRLVGQIIFL